MQPFFISNETGKLMVHYCTSVSEVKCKITVNSVRGSYSNDMYKTIIIPRGPYTIYIHTRSPTAITDLSAAGKALIINILASTQLSSYIFIFINKLDILISSFFYIKLFFGQNVQ